MEETLRAMKETMMKNSTDEGIKKYGAEVHGNDVRIRLI